MLASFTPHLKRHLLTSCMLLLLLLFPFAGVGGFNTPIALGAPMLASLGHDPLTSLLVVVVFNTLASHMGSMGMAVWFGFKILGAHKDEAPRHDRRHQVLCSFGQLGGGGLSIIHSRHFWWSCCSTRWRHT
jgi:hypothetical protein